MFLTDVFIIENLQILEEASSDKPMKVRGIFQRAEEANNNKRVYPKTVLESQMGKLQPLIEGRRLCGELDHPSNDTVKLSNASHLITKLEMKGNEVLGEAEILNTPAGLTAKALIKGGVQIGISSRGMGTLSESADGTKKVNEDFKLVTFDLVADPSTRGAYPTLSESTQYQEILKKSTEERVFIMQLQEEIDKKLRVDEGDKGGHRTKLKRKKRNARIKKEKQAATKASRDAASESERKKKVSDAEARLRDKLSGPSKKTKDAKAKLKDKLSGINKEREKKEEPTKEEPTPQRRKTDKPPTLRAKVGSLVHGFGKSIGAGKERYEKYAGPKGTTRKTINVGLNVKGKAEGVAKGLSGRLASMSQKFASTTGVKGSPGAASVRQSTPQLSAPTRQQVTRGAKEDIAKAADVRQKRAEKRGETKRKGDPGYTGDGEDRREGKDRRDKERRAS